MINHIPTRLNPGHPKFFLKLVEHWKISMRWGVITPFEGFENSFVVGYRLGGMGELWQFLRAPNEGVWKIKSSCEQSNSGFSHKNIGNQNS